jgi:hypothetical protein
LGTQDIRRRQTDQTKAQKTKNMNRPHQKLGINTGEHEE